MAQSPKTSQDGASLYHLYRQCNLYSLNIQLNEVEAITHALCWIASRGDSQPTHAIILTDSVSLLQKVEWEAQTGICQWSTSTFGNSCGCTALDMLEWREMTVQIDWQAKQPSQVACFSEALVLRSLRHFLWAQSQGHHNTDHLEERGIKRGSARWSSLKGGVRAIVNKMNIGTVSEGNFEREEVEKG